MERNNNYKGVDMKKKKKYSLKKRDAVDNAVYVFHNQLFNFDLFINALNADDAMEKFDQCQMADRKHWKIMVEIGHQPA